MLEKICDICGKDVCKYYMHEVCMCYECFSIINLINNTKSKEDLMNKFQRCIKIEDK